MDAVTRGSRSHGEPLKLEGHRRKSVALGSDYRRGTISLTEGEPPGIKMDEV